MMNRMPEHFAISRFNSSRDRVPKMKRKSWAELVKMLTLRQIWRLRDGPAFSPASYSPGKTRNNANVEAVSLLVLEFGDGADADALSRALADAGLASLGYSVYTHTPECPKWCAVLPFVEPVPAADWPAAWKALVAALAPQGVDKSCKAPARIYLLPICPPDRHLDAFTFQTDGKPLDWRSILAKYKAKKRKSEQQQTANDTNREAVQPGLTIPPSLLRRYSLFSTNGRAQDEELADIPAEPVDVVSATDRRSSGPQRASALASAPDEARQLLAEYARLIRAAKASAFPMRVEIDPGDGWPTIFNPHAAVRYADLELHRILQGEGDAGELPRLRRDLAVVQDWLQIWV
jgi:hypothetical protein